MIARMGPLRKACSSPRRCAYATHPVVRPVRHRRPRKHAVLLRRARLAPLRRRTALSLHIVVEARDDVASRRAVQVRGLLARDAVLDRRLAHVVSTTRIVSSYPDPKGLTSFRSWALRRSTSSRTLAWAFLYSDRLAGALPAAPPLLSAIGADVAAMDGECAPIKIRNDEGPRAQSARRR